MNNPVKLFVVEGEVRDLRFAKELTECFFSSGRYQAKIINLPASQNIYMLYKLLKEDEFDTDLVEILRDNVPSAQEVLDGISRDEIDEVYLFFDYDTHQNNISRELNISSDDVVRTLLSIFDNETEYGKLYLSYPMVEALYDYKPLMCESSSSCFIPVERLTEYKRIASEDNPKASVRFGFEEWSEVLGVFVLRIECLFNLSDISFDNYRKSVSSVSIFEQEILIKQNKEAVFVLSCFPEFLFDYFRIDFWNKFAKLKHFKFDKCTK